jgi:phosphoribosylamine--glycine ligase
MKFLLIGDRAREHIIAEHIARDGAELYSIMSLKNPAIASLSKQHWIRDIEDSREVSSAIHGMRFSLCFSSPDVTLRAGMSDMLAKKGFHVASPSKRASRIEWDKSFMRGLLRRHSIPSLRYVLARTEKGAMDAMVELGEVAIKPLGLTGGKGVKVSGDHFTSPGEGMEYASALIKQDGSVLIEEKIEGEEFSLQAFCDGKTLGFMPPVQDFKRALEGDTGGNTGGMGSYSTGRNLPFLRGSDLDAGKRIMRMTIDAMRADGLPFVGVLYGQFMATSKGIKLIEYNARFADPESMNALSVLNGSLLDVMVSMARGNLKAPRFSSDSTVVKYLVPKGYPDNPLHSYSMAVDSAAIRESGAHLYYGSVFRNGDDLSTTPSHSRTLAVVGRASTLEEAEAIAERGCAAVEGHLYHRSDIGKKETVERKIEHMKELRA